MFNELNEQLFMQLVGFLFVKSDNVMKLNSQMNKRHCDEQAHIL